MVLLGAGSSTRFGLDVKKQWLRVGDEPLWKFVLDRFKKMHHFDRIIIVAPKDEVELFRAYSDQKVIVGGRTRQESILNALKNIETPYVLISDIARACVQPKVIENILVHIGQADCIAPYIPAVDTVVYEDRAIDRSKVKLIQTPQLSKTDILAKAFAMGEFTDESSAIQSIGGKVLYLPGDVRQRKLTFKEDLKYLECLTPPVSHILVGQGFDVHRFCEGRHLFLCGVSIDYEKGLLGHSDADVAIHALIDALLGAAGFGDIGELFPDTDASYEGIESTKLLQKCRDLLTATGFVIKNVDLTIMAQAPKLLPYKTQMRQNISQILNIPKAKCNIKATTTEKLGFVGRAEGIAAQAVATLEYFDWSKHI